MKDFEDLVRRLRVSPMDPYPGSKDVTELMSEAADAIEAQQLALKAHAEIGYPPSRDLETDIADLLNRHSVETASGTPDFILAEYLMSCLRAYNGALIRRADWRGESIDFRRVVGADEIPELGPADAE